MTCHEQKARRRLPVRLSATLTDGTDQRRRPTGRSPARCGGYLMSSLAPVARRPSCMRRDAPQAAGRDAFRIPYGRPAICNFKRRTRASRYRRRRQVGPARRGSRRGVTRRRERIPRLIWKSPPPNSHAVTPCPEPCFRQRSHGDDDTTSAIWTSSAYDVRSEAHILAVVGGSVDRKIPTRAGDSFSLDPEAPTRRSPGATPQLCHGP